jgi:hypothetical protein
MNDFKTHALPANNVIEQGLSYITHKAYVSAEQIPILADHLV